MKNFPNKDLQNILSDNTSGSTDIVLKINTYFSRISGNEDLILNSIELLNGKLSHFTAVKKYLNNLKKELSNRGFETIKLYATNYLKELTDKYNSLYSNASPILLKYNTFLTLSNSKSLIETFSRLRKDNPNIKVIVLESRPKMEGRLLSKALLKHEIKVELLTDAELSLAVPESDALIIGADTILKNGNVINKVGSRAAAVLFRRSKKPVFVISTKDKFSSKKFFRPALMKGSEVWNYSHKNLTIKNIYFEEVESGLLTKIITD